MDRRPPDPPPKSKKPLPAPAKGPFSCIFMIINCLDMHNYAIANLKIHGYCYE
jgi:hypothetical protein